MTTRFDPRPRDLDQARFVARYGAVYERSPWVAEQVFLAGLDERHDTASGLADAMRAVVEQAGHETQMELLRAHPDLGGRAAIRGELTTESSAEQASAGLDACSPEQYARLMNLNEEYRERFGFPFILAVRNRTRDEILERFAARLDNAPEAEFRTALDQVHEIARLRLVELAHEDQQR